MSERRVAHYRVLEPIGQGGMGTVYEAEDTRLGRPVAIKFLSSSLASDPKAVARFLREARAASNLSHPHICRVLDVGEDGPERYIVMERLEGRTLKSAMAGRPMPATTVLDLGAQMAEALEAAHAHDVVHRDVKPSNVFLTRDGEIKLTDFGLAKVAEPPAPAAEDTTRSGEPDRLTRSGATVGTVGYMSPEQARGEEVDARSDLFSLGAVLYEMATGRAPFGGATDAVSFEALLGRDPPPASEVNPAVPPALEAILAKALEKDPRARYQTAADLRVDLLRARRSSGSDRLPESGTRMAWLRRGAVATAVLLAVLVGAAASRWFREHPQPRFTQLTFRRGIVLSARFAPDGRTVVYSALWDGRSPEIFARRLEDPASVSLGLPPATLLAVSSKAELAILLAPDREVGALWRGTLARVPLSGGPVRPVLDDVLDADWSPDGRELAVIRWQDGRFQLEFPLGEVLLRPCPPTRLRVSPDGEHVAVLDEQEGLLLLDRAGNEIRIPVARWRQRLAWSPVGDSLVVDAGESDLRRSLRRVQRDGSVSEVLALPGTLVVHDVGRDGSVLIHHGFERWDVRARRSGWADEREASAFANSGVAGLSGDGSRVLLWHHGEGPPGLALLQSTGGGPPLRIGEGRPHGLSSDGNRVVVETGGVDGPRLMVAPTGAGEARPLPAGGLRDITGVWHLDEKEVGFHAASRSYLADLPDGPARPITPEGAVVVPGSAPDGPQVTRSPDGTLTAYPAVGGEGRTLPWRLSPDPLREIVRVSGDGRYLFVKEGSVPARVDRIGLRSGRREPWMRLAPPDKTGVGHVWSVHLTPDGQGYAYTHGFFLQDLFLVEALP